MIRPLLRKLRAALPHPMLHRLHRSLPRTFPTAGVFALITSVCALSGEAALLRGPSLASAGNDPTDADERQKRAAATRQLWLMKTEAGVGILGVGIGLTGWAALSAMRGGPADRFLAGVSGACCLIAAATWLTFAVAAGLGEPNDGPSWDWDGFVIYDDF